MNSASYHLWLFTRQQITTNIFTGTFPVTDYSTTRRWDVWRGMAGWRQQVSSVGTVGLARSTHRSSSLTAMTATLMIGFTHILQSHHIYPFILKAGDSNNDQPNDNRPNLKLKIYYDIAKVKWQRQHGTMKFPAYHMNAVLVEMWHSFQQQSACVIIYAFKKTKLPPLAPPDHDTNTQACLEAIQTPSGKKSEEIE